MVALDKQKYLYSCSAVFDPMRTDDLKHGSEQYIGKRYTFTYSHTIDEGRPYEGQYAMHCEAFHGWVPWEDLRDVCDYEYLED